MNGHYKYVGAGGNVSDWVRDRSLFSLDLETQFPVETLLASTFVQNSTIPLNVTPANIGGNGMWQGALLATSDTFVAYAQDDPSEEETHTLVSYNSISRQWGSVSLSGGDFQSGPRAFGTGVSDSMSGLSFYLGGDHNIGGLLKVELADTNNPSWSNITTRFRDTQDQIPQIWGGGMAYLAIGKAGILLVIGGSFNVTTTGTPSIPSGRTEFCLAVSRAPDGSSFQVTLYGGYNETSNDYHDDVWALSVPSFRWISVSDTNNGERDNDGPKAGRKGHTCHMWQESQMIVLGGIYARNAATLPQGDGRNSVCDTTYSPIRLLDTSSYSWQTQFIPNGIEYKVPPVVIDVIGGDASGSSTLTSPQRGWNDPLLADIFSRRLPRVSTFRATSTSKIDTASPTARPSASIQSSTPGTPPEIHKGNMKAIVGGVIAGVVTVIVGLAWYILHKRQQRRSRNFQVVHLKPEPDASTTWHKAELENNVRCELTGSAKPLPELPEESRNVRELPAHYMGVELYGARASAPLSLSLAFDSGAQQSAWLGRGSKLRGGVPLVEYGKGIDTLD
ncbi:MAG: hypothetical protein Q9182_003451 [Xanthomendoza sp. 2 TL-2023]